MRESLQAYRGIGTGAAERGDGITQLTYPGLVDQEINILRALIELREVSAEQVAQRTGVTNGLDVQAALDRLVHLTFAVALPQGSGRRYRPIVQQH